MTEYVYKLKNGEIVSAYADEKGNISITKEALEIMVNSWNNGYQQGATDMEKAKQIIIDSLLQQIEQIKAEVIEEFAKDIINKINFEDKWLFACRSNNADTNVMISALKTFVKSRAEQLKEQK